MHYPLLITTAILTFVLGVGIFKISIPLALRWNLNDVPSSRRRHLKPTPIIGGVSLFFAWSLGLTFFSVSYSAWFYQYSQSILAISASVGILIGMGLVDDLKGVGPVGKLSWQFIAAAIILMFEPKVHSFCLHWEPVIGFVIWPLSAIWLVGLSNAINLVDGLDGLAGGISFLVASSLALLSFKWGSSGEFSIVLMTLLIASIGSFLFNNWHPAKIFLGDNGSLPLGFLMGTVSLMSPTEYRHSWLQVISLLLMMGYPILDMGLCTLRRFRHGHPLFKADRNHLHHRLLRFGLSVPQVGVLLLSVTFYLQLTSLSINTMSADNGIIFMGAIALSLFTVLYLLRAIEVQRMKRLSKLAHRKQDHVKPVAILPKQFHSSVQPLIASEVTPSVLNCVIAKISLEPLFEAGLFEEKERIHDIIPSLKLMLQSMIRKEDILYQEEHSLNIIFMHEKPAGDASVFDEAEHIQRLSLLIKEKLSLFREVYNLQYSLADLPLKFEKQPLLIYKKIDQLKPSKKAA